MQPDPQAPSQSRYPQIEEAPQQSGFNVVQNNPFNQPQQQRQVYVPPPQYTMPIQESPIPPQNIEDELRREVERIDKHLSSGLYFCYNILLYIAAILMVRAMYSSASHMINYSSDIFSFIREIAFFAYAVTMIVTFRNKKVATAELGLKIAIVAVVLTPITLYLGWSYYSYWTRSQLLKNALLPIFPYLIAVSPVLKVRSHLQEREEIVKGSSLSLDI